MSHLSPEARALVDAARPGDDPTDGDRTRVRRALAVQLGVGVGAALTASTSASTSAAAVTTAVKGSAWLLAMKVVAAVAVTSGVTVGGVSVYRASHEPAVRPSAAVSASVVNPTANLTAPTALTPTAISPFAAIAPNTDSSSRPLAVSATPLAVWGTGVTAPARAFGTAPAVPSPPSTLVAETRLLRDADTALRVGDAGRALALLDQHAREFPSGVLAEERAAERILALCKLGRASDARVEATRFLTERPRSPLAGRVRSSCDRP